MREGGNAWIQECIVGTLGANVQFEEYTGQPVEEMTVDRLVGRGGAIVGTPDHAIRRVREIWEASGGGLKIPHAFARIRELLSVKEDFQRILIF